MPSEMYKIIGIIMLLGASFAASFVVAKQIRERVENLTYIREIMILFRGELEYRNSILPDAFRAVSMKVRHPFNQLFMELSKEVEDNFDASIADIFKNKIDFILKGQLCLKSKDLAKIKEAGDMLGVQSKKMQLNNLDLYIERLSITIEEERGKMVENMKVYRTLIMMLGIMLTIMII